MRAIFNYKEDGDAYFGNIDVQSLGLQASAQHGPNTFLAVCKNISVRIISHF